MNTLFLIIAVLVVAGVVFKVISLKVAVLAVAGALVAWGIATYNQFVQLSNRVAEAWSDIEVQMKRRYNLIPNLVETVKGYAAHEKDVFESVTQARAAAMGATSMADHAKSENMLTNTLKSLFAVAEAYPQLRANENFLELQRELTDTEDKIQASRRFYNGNVRDYNTLRESFPSNMIANAFKYAKKEFFELEEEAARAPVQVKF
ncbi:MAG: LemA family protein [Candidatus Azambacteria bacterium]|nr:LemA family protein [Candidatus Azambacteria bacterium]